jgi:prepilin peptidase CpaA
MSLVCLSVAIVTDLAHRIIPNGLVIIVLGCGASLRLESGSWPLVESLLSASAVLAVAGLLAAYDFLGWGDAKLITAVTFIVPVDRVIPLLLAIALAGGLLGCLYLAVRFALRRMSPRPHQLGAEGGDRWDLPRLVRREAARIRANEPMPYAVAVLGGVAFGLAAR